MLLIEEMNEAEAATADDPRVNIAGIQYQPAGKVFDFDCGNLDLLRGQTVVVETDRGPTLGVVAWEPQLLERPRDRKLKRVLRLAETDDLATASKHRDRAEKAIRLAIQRARYYKLKFKLVTAEFPLQGDRVIFYFASEDRVDYRPLVKDLGHELRVRVEMRQIGPRDVAKSAGGIGPCGRELCCSSWLREFQPVSIKMAKDQGLALNPQKVSGNCGRLLCCLGYEHEGYVENKQGMPKIGKFVQTEMGRAKVTSIDILNRRVRGLLEDGSTEQFSADDITLLKGPQPQHGPEPRGRARDRERGREKDRERARERERETQGRRDAPGDAARADAPKGDASTGDAPKGDARKGDARKGDARKGDAPKGDAPKSDAPKSDAPKKDAPSEPRGAPASRDERQGSEASGDDKPRRRRRRRRRRKPDGETSGGGESSGGDGDSSGGSSDSD